MKSIILGCLLLPLAAASQTRVAVYAGANFPSIELLTHQSGFSSELRDDWYPGIDFGLGVQIPILDWIEISPQFEYSHYLFHHFYIQTIGGPPFLISSSGQASHAYRLLLEGRLSDRISSGGAIFFSTGLAYIVESLGTIYPTWSDPSSPLVYQPLGRHFFAHTIGLGGLIRLSDPLFLELSLRMYTNYSDPWDLSSNLGVSFRLPK